MHFFCKWKMCIFFSSKGPAEHCTCDLPGSCRLFRIAFCPYLLIQAGSYLSAGRLMNYESIHQRPRSLLSAAGYDDTSSLFIQRKLLMDDVGGAPQGCSVFKLWRQVHGEDPSPTVIGRGKNAEFVTCYTLNMGVTCSEGWTWPLRSYFMVLF